MPFFFQPLSLLLILILIQKKSIILSEVSRGYFRIRKGEFKDTAY
jgi:hypothetical protein